MLPRSLSLLCRRNLRARIGLVSPPRGPKITHRFFSTTARLFTEFTEITPNGGRISSVEPIFEITDASWVEKVVNGGHPVLIECTTSEDTSPQVVEFKSNLSELILKEKGAISLAKLDVNKTPELAKAMQVQDFPTLVAVWQGKFIYKLPGVHKKEALEDLISNVLHHVYYPELKEILSEAEGFYKQENIPEAARLYNQILTTPKLRGDAFALCGLAQCSMKEGNIEMAQKLVDQAKNNPKFAGHPFVKQVSSQVELFRQGSTGINETELLEKIQTDPLDLKSRYDLGVFYAQSNQTEKCFEQMFAIIKADKEWNQQAAKVFLLETISALGDSDLAKKGRRGLQNLWFR